MRSSRRAYVAILLLLAVLSCPPAVKITPPPADAPPELVALTGASVLIGVGDIAACDSRGDELTAAIVDSVLKADSVAKVEDAVFTLGDNAYPVGSVRNFTECFTPSWGDKTKRIMKKIHPLPGNHEHETDMAAPYYLYFGDIAGSPRKGYYSYDVGEWHVIVLNSAIVVDPGFRESERQAQNDWLRDDLKNKSKPCTMAMWHHPRFSSGYHGNNTNLGEFWNILYNAGADLILTGHDHEYERFAAMTPAATVDTLKGIPSYVIGTGGGELRGFRRSVSAHSLARIEGHFGVLKLTLGKGEFRAAFLDTQGRVWDSSGGKCH
jgi:acid phosphatase type 7